MNKIINHFLTITKHRLVVCKLCFKLHIYYQGLTHDLSKYSWPEFSRGCRYFQGFRSPNEKEREINGYSTAWIHHKGRNKHHFEYWTDINPNKQYVPVEMPIKYVKEMFCDRIAASMIYNKNNYSDAISYDYFMSHNDRNKMNQKTADILESWLKMLKEKGEDFTFDYINKNY